MASMLWRILLAVVGCVLIFALIPPVFRLIGLDLSADLVTVLRICIAGIALFYVLKGPPFPA
jgi:hypothetical protein